MKTLKTKAFYIGTIFGIILSITLLLFLLSSGYLRNEEIINTINMIKYD